MGCTADGIGDAAKQGVAITDLADRELAVDGVGIGLEQRVTVSERVVVGVGTAPKQGMDVFELTALSTCTVA
jgi:hypothetical protein